MSFLKFRSIKSKIAVLSGLCMICTAAVLVGVSLELTKKSNADVEKNVTTLLESKTKDYMQNVASTQAGKIQSEFDVALQGARTMADTFSAIVGNPSDPGVPTSLRRKHINNILLASLKSNTHLNGTYTAWEPEALDGQDEAYRNNKEMGSDHTGRFIPYWTRDAHGRIAIQPLVEYDSRDLHPNGVMKGGWYLGPQANGKESVLDPLPYIVQGKEVYLATLSVPIKANGKFLGVAGTDFNLDFVGKLASDVSNSIFKGKSKVIILSNMGLIVAHSEKPELVGKSFASESKTWNSDLSTIQQGKAFVDWQESKGIESLRIFAPITLGSTEKPWSVLISVPKDVVLAEAIKLGEDLRNQADYTMFFQLIVAAIAIVFALGAMWIVATGINSPIVSLTEAMTRLSKGDNNVDVPDQNLKDEIGSMARTVQIFKNNAIEMDGLKAKQAERDKIAAADKKKLMNNLADDFEKSVGQVVSVMGSSILTLQKNAEELTTIAEQTKSQSTNAAAATEEASASVQTVASAAEELSASINEINTKVTESATVAGDAVKEVKHTEETVSTLSNAATQIGDVVKIIQEIANQTNLLALNATIEAARAGDAGKGFAVVAGEVKNLASQTAKATEDISQKIDSMQTVSTQAVDAMQRIGHIIEKINEISTVIANAIQQQTKATSEIAHNVQQASTGTSVVSGNIVSVSEAAVESQTSAKEVQSAAEDLSRQSSQLRQEVENFLTKVRGG